ncbi:DUF4258 domain-containing protein [Bradyrhizobium sp. JYMT SZCCT0428]|uniref:DUF4258 domain-containing protein n=1 Tax=Bradyrhizobium sp. JYMT SZCCT0428 TaxID=2807673 RepID=UPI001BA67788|nr:DUF4258 domain-containing protein [Bradyrhizobium sp. JYMT SZCCT0428]MBR1151208.1 DUF4258 domain-containing protein [Bradyrhizobium sp. JYMT SZCCT0428]
MFSISNHAELRCRQRGISEDSIERIFENADCERDIGNHCTLIRVSQQFAKAMNLGYLSQLAVVWSESHAQVVTVLFIHENARGRRYRAKH